MPYIIRPRQMHKMAAGFISSLLLLCVAPALAHAAACPKGATSHPFASHGDNASYALVPGSSFESGAPGWSLEEAAVAQDEAGSGEYQGDEEASQSEASSDHAHYLHVKPHGVAVSPAFCVSSEYPTYRLYFKKKRGRENATLNIALRWTDSSGQHEVSGDSLEAGKQWTLSPVLDLASRLPVSTPGSSVSVNFVFTCSGKSSWAIDDVYIDPYSR